MPRIISLHTVETLLSAIYRQCNEAPALSDQAVRRMINKYTSLAAIELHIIPHMFQHTFATRLLEADIDIRYIQEMLIHSLFTLRKYIPMLLYQNREIS